MIFHCYVSFQLGFFEVKHRPPKFLPQFRAVKKRGPSLTSCGNGWIFMCMLNHYIILLLLYHIILYYVMLCYVNYIISYYFSLYRIMLNYIILYYIILYYIYILHIKFLWFSISYYVNIHGGFKLPVKPTII